MAGCDKRRSPIVTCPATKETTILANTGPHGRCTAADMSDPSDAMPVRRRMSVGSGRNVFMRCSPGGSYRYAQQDAILVRPGLSGSEPAACRFYDPRICAAQPRCVRRRGDGGGRLGIQEPRADPRSASGAAPCLQSRGGTIAACASASTAPETPRCGHSSRASGANRRRCCGCRPRSGPETLSSGAHSAPPFRRYLWRSGGGSSRAAACGVKASRIRTSAAGSDCRAASGRRADRRSTCGISGRPGRWGRARRHTRRSTAHRRHRRQPTR
jgi:hypothetical protein